MLLIEGLLESASVPAHEGTVRCVGDHSMGIDLNSGVQHHLSYGATPIRETGPERLISLQRLGRRVANLPVFRRGGRAATMGEGLEYDPGANRATLTARGPDWYLWIEWPNDPTAIPYLMTRDEVGEAVGEHRLGEPERSSDIWNCAWGRSGIRRSASPAIRRTPGWQAGRLLPVGTRPGRMVTRGREAGFARRDGRFT